MRKCTPHPHSTHTCTPQPLPTHTHTCMHPPPPPHTHAHSPHTRMHAHSPHTRTHTPSRHTHTSAHTPLTHTHTHKVPMSLSILQSFFLVTHLGQDCQHAIVTLRQLIVVLLRAVRVLFIVLSNLLLKERNQLAQCLLCTLDLWQLGGGALDARLVVVSHHAHISEVVVISHADGLLEEVEAVLAAAKSAVRASQFAQGHGFCSEKKKKKRPRGHKHLMQAFWKMAGSCKQCKPGIFVCLLFYFNVRKL